MDLKAIEPGSPDYPLLDSINREAFPAWERVETPQLFDLARQPGAELLGLYEEDRLAGFMMLLKNQCCGYLLFFAVSGELRARGHGTAALKALFRRYEGLPIALDFEPVDEAAENNAQRIRRKAFYLRSGFHETGLYTRTCGRGFELVCHGPDPERPALTALLEQIHTVFTDFSPWLYDTP